MRAEEARMVLLGVLLRSGKYRALFGPRYVDSMSIRLSLRLACLA